MVSIITQLCDNGLGHQSMKSNYLPFIWKTVTTVLKVWTHA